ncbi:hypothetical protein LUX33_39935 [Actinomadura madurae]|nr:hypothetical protein [Actinomadura madurae]MCP9953992.1 hypothetical protein [Actinomadura madurae]MCP9970736.1 hypothetical protein [Actinomadura madurae]
MTTSAPQPGRLRPPHERLGEGHVRLDEELEPQPGLGRRRRDVPDRDGRGHAHHHDRLGAGRRPRRGPLALGGGEPVERGRRDEDGRRRAVAEQRDARLGLLDPGEHAGDQREAPERGLVGAQGGLVARAAREVVAVRRVEALAGRRLELAQRGR